MTGAEAAVWLYEAPFGLLAHDTSPDPLFVYANLRAQKGCVDGYRGLRVAKSGRLFWIEDVTVWNILGPESALVGQAALVRRWADA